MWERMRHTWSQCHVSVCMCVCVSLHVYVRSKRNESECLDMCTCDRPWSWLLGLERWCMQTKNCKVRRNSVGCSWRYWRANRSLCSVLGRKTNRTIRITGSQQRVQVKRMIEGIGNVPCSTYSQTLRRVKWTHGVFQRVTHDTQHHNTTHHHNTTQHSITHNTTRRQRQWQTERERERERERRQGQREKRRRKRRDKTREEKTKEDKTRQEKREDSFSVWWCMAVFCWCSDFLVNSVCAREFSLLNSVKCDSSFISFSALWQFNSFFFEYLRIIYSMQLQLSIFLNLFFGYAVTVSKFQNYSVMQIQFFFCWN